MNKEIVFRSVYVHRPYQLERIARLSLLISCLFSNCIVMDQVSWFLAHGQLLLSSGFGNLPLTRERAKRRKREICVFVISIIPWPVLRFRGAVVQLFRSVNSLLKIEVECAYLSSMMLMRRYPFRAKSDTMFFGSEAYCFTFAPKTHI